MKKTILLLTALMCGSLSVMAYRTQYDVTEYVACRDGC